MTTDLKRTPLYALHASLGAKLVPFGGFEMPVQYREGIAAEHRAVREGVGVFDISHMGEFEVTGPDRNAFVQHVTCNDVGALKPGQAQYSALLTDQGTFVDDCVVYRFADKLMLVVNAANIAADWEQVVSQKRGANVRLRDISDETGLLAVQGPGAKALLAPLTTAGIDLLPYYHFVEGKVAGKECFISRTGYTGRSDRAVLPCGRPGDAVYGGGAGARSLVVWACPRHAPARGAIRCTAMHDVDGRPLGQASGSKPDGRDFKGPRSSSGGLPGLGLHGCRAAAAARPGHNVYVDDRGRRRAQRHGDHRQLRGVATYLPVNTPRSARFDDVRATARPPVAALACTTPHAPAVSRVAERIRSRIELSLLPRRRTAERRKVTPDVDRPVHHHDLEHAVRINAKLKRGVRDDTT